MKLNPIFASHMVFAAGKPLRIYGEGTERITVSLNGRTRSTQAQDGRWEIELDPMDCGGPYRMEISSEGGETVRLEDVHIGEVYLFAGQSNMQLRLDETVFPAERYEDNDKLRFFAAERMESGEPFSPEDGWMISTRDTAGRRSAIGYLAGGEIAHRKGAAVGVICCYQGASIIESWMPAGTLERIGIDIPLEKRHPDRASGTFDAWNGDGVLYEFALSQVIPFALSGVVWYQGESDASMEEGAEYGCELEEMISIWRRDFRDDALPFVIVQLADFIRPMDQTGWQLVQRAQAEIAGRVKRVKTVVCADDCEKNLIHPMRKEVLSHRVAEALTEFMETRI